MKVSELLKSDKVTISVELFPPKKGSQLENYKAIVGQMAELKPSYISCTYGATGGTSDYTVEIADTINSYGIPAIAHLTCASSTKEKVQSVIKELKDRKIENILALRGDIPEDADFPLPDQYHHAIELIGEIKEIGDFCIGGACYPDRSCRFVEFTCCVCRCGKSTTCSFKSTFLAIRSMNGTLK